MHKGSRVTGCICYLLALTSDQLRQVIDTPSTIDIKMTRMPTITVNMMMMMMMAAAASLTGYVRAGGGVT